MAASGRGGCCCGLRRCCSHCTGSVCGCVAVNLCLESCVCMFCYCSEESLGGSFSQAANMPYSHVPLSTWLRSQGPTVPGQDLFLSSRSYAGRTEYQHHRWRTRLGPGALLGPSSRSPVLLHPGERRISWEARDLRPRDTGWKVQRLQNVKSCQISIGRSVLINTVSAIPESPTSLGVF